MRRLKMFCLTMLAVAALASVALAVEKVATPQPTQNPPVATAKAPPLPLLWKVSDADNAVYLLGSFHLLKGDDYPLSADIDSAFAASDKVVFEVPPEQMTDPATAQKFLAAAGYGDGRTLTQVLPAALREKFARIVAQRGFSVAQFDGYEPWFINLSLMLGMADQMGFKPERGMDQYLMQRAATGNKPTAGLESIDTQLQVLDASPMDEQIVSLKEFLDKPLEMPQMLGDLHSAWRDGDVARLDKLTREEMRDKTPQTYRMINVDRNQAWLPQIQVMLDDSKQGSTLVVVGALHLLGDDGIVGKLREKGYKVERVCSACSEQQLSAL